MSGPPIDDVRLRAVSGGDAAIELELVEMLLEEAEPIVAGLSDMESPPDLATAHELSHSLKGIAGNIGAIELRDAAAAFDAAVGDRERPWSELRGHIASLSAALERVRTAREARVAALGTP